MLCHEGLLSLWLEEEASAMMEECKLGCYRFAMSVIKRGYEELCEVYWKICWEWKIK
jgi:hypothetical protein